MSWSAQMLGALQPHPTRCCRTPEALSGLQKFCTGTAVYVGGNPFARKVRLHLLSPSTIPGCQPGTVATGSAATSFASEIRMSGKSRVAATTPTTSLAANKDVSSSSVRDSVVLKMDKALPDKPTLAKSLTSSLHVVSDALDKPDAQQLRFQGLDHNKLVQVFDKLKDEIDGWQQLATVHEEEMEHVQAEVGRTFITDVAVDDKVRFALCCGRSTLLFGISLMFRTW